MTNSPKNGPEMYPEKLCDLEKLCDPEMHPEKLWDPEDVSLTAQNQIPWLAILSNSVCHRMIHGAWQGWLLSLRFKEN